MPLVWRCRTMPTRRKSSAALKTSGRRSGSPPEKSTSRVPNGRSASAMDAISGSVRSPAPEDFHQSHETQRLLQRLVGKKMTMGSTSVRLVSSPSLKSVAVRAFAAVMVPSPRLLTGYRGRLLAEHRQDHPWRIGTSEERQAVHAAPQQGEPRALRHATDGVLEPAPPKRFGCPIRAERRMNQTVKGPIELGDVRSLMHHREVVGIDPVLFCTELPPHALVKPRSGQRIGDRYPDIIGTAGSNHLKRTLDVLERLARITELEKEAHLDVLVVQPSACIPDLVGSDALLHRIEDSLRARFRPDPHRAASGRLERSGDGASHAVGPHQALERNAGVAFNRQLREALDPTGLQPEDVIDDPEVI